MSLNPLGVGLFINKMERLREGEEVGPNLLQIGSFCSASNYCDSESSVFPILKSSDLRAPRADSG